MEDRSCLLSNTFQSIMFETVNVMAVQAVLSPLALRRTTAIVVDDELRISPEIICCDLCADTDCSIWPHCTAGREFAQVLVNLGGRGTLQFGVATARECASSRRVSCVGALPLGVGRKALHLPSPAASSSTTAGTSEEEGLHVRPLPHILGDFFSNVAEFFGGGGTGPSPHNVGEYHDDNKPAWFRNSLRGPSEKISMAPTQRVFRLAGRILGAVHFVFHPANHLRSKVSYNS